MLLLSIALFLRLTYPEIDSAIKLYNENKELETKIQSINEKRKKAEVLDLEIGKNKEKEDGVGSLLPMKRAEERAMNSIIKIAEEKLLVITAIEIGKDSTAAISEEVPVGQGSTGGEKSMTGTAGQNSASSGSGTDSLKKTTVKVSVLGQYDDIKSFAYALDGIDMSNHVVSANIAEPNSTATTETQAKTETTVTTTAQPEEKKTLVAELVVNFYYAKKIISKDYMQEGIFESKGELNFGDYDFAASFVKTNMQKLELLEKGRKNPFLETTIKNDSEG